MRAPLSSSAARPWRPQPRTTLVLVVLALAIGAIGWAAIGGAATSTITACADPANNALFLSNNGTCQSGQTTVVWNQQGPQGPQGPPGAQATSPVVAGLVHTTFKNGFSISTAINSAATYVITGSVKLLANTRHWSAGSAQVACELFTGPPSQSATLQGQSSQIFFYNKAKRVWVPPSFSGTQDVTAVYRVLATQVPTEVYFSCKLHGTGHKLASFTDPSIDAKQVTGAHVGVGPALPLHQSIGPGPLQQIR